MTTQKELRSLRDAIIAAESSIRIAKQILATMLGDSKFSSEFSVSTDGLSQYNDGEIQIVEGIFTGENMLGADGNTYPVPHNYASKSLLVQGSRLKAIIAGNGKISYKIIEEIDYETKLGIVTKV